MTLPPSPPSPPSGPPLGTYFSRRKLTHPSPPRPASSWISTRSTNMHLLPEHVSEGGEGAPLLGFLLPSESCSREVPGRARASQAPLGRAPMTHRDESGEATEAWRVSRLRLMLGRSGVRRTICPPRRQATWPEGASG